MDGFPTTPTTPYVLPQLQRQGLRLRLGFGAIKKLIPMANGQMAIISSGGARLLDLRTRQTHWEVDCPAHDGALSPDGSRLALIGLTDAWLWDTSSGSLLWHREKIAEVGQDAAFSPDGRFLLLAEGWNRVGIYDPVTGQELRRLVEDDGGDIIQIAFSPDGRLLGTVSCFSKWISLWDMERGERVAHLRSGTADEDDPLSGYSLAFSPDGSRLAMGFQRGRLEIWNLKSVTKTHWIDTHQINWDPTVAFSPDSRFVVAGGEDALIHLWELDVDEARELLCLSGHHTPVRSLAFIDGGRLLYSGDDDGVIRGWELPSGQAVESILGYDANFPWFHQGGKEVSAVCGDAVLRFWQTSTGDLVRSILDLPSNILVASFSSDGRLIAFGTESRLREKAAERDHGTIELWDLNTGRVLWSRMSESHSLKALAFSSDGSLLASGGWHAETQIWQVESGQEVQRVTLPTGKRRHPYHSTHSLAFAPCSHLLALGESNERVRLWDVDASQERVCLPRHANDVEALAFSPEGRLLASGSGSGSIRLWDVREGKPAGRLRWRPGYPGGDVESLAISPDGLLLAAGCEDATLRIFRLDTLQQIRILHGYAYRQNNLTFSDDGRYLASGSSGTVRIWAVEV